MSQNIKEQWDNAQIHEKVQYPKNRPFNINFDDPHSRERHYWYENYLKFLGLDFDLKGQSIMEIGAGETSVLCFCYNFDKSYIIEPLIFEETLEYYKSRGITVINKPIEEYEPPKTNQAWMFNLLQHTIDPGVIIEKVKKYTDVIYFFEPLYRPVDDCHLHVLTEDLFVKAFGRENVKIYEMNTIPNFFGCNCAYGKFITK